MTREIEAILDECLDRIQAEGLSVEECLASYPEAAEELRALLSLASDLQQSLGPANPRPDFVASSSTRMANRLRARASRRHSQKPEPSAGTRKSRSPGDRRTGGFHVRLMPSQASPWSLHSWEVGLASSLPPLPRCRAMPSTA